MITGYIKCEDLLRSVVATNHEPAGNFPLSVPQGELYFWTSEWQRGEREALREIKEGKARRFDNPTDAVRWLKGDED